MTSVCSSISWRPGAECLTLPLGLASLHAAFCLLLAPVQVRDKAAEKELAALRRANKEMRKEREQQLDATWGDE